jgi:hypothetical protein
MSSNLQESKDLFGGIIFLPSDMDAMIDTRKYAKLIWNALGLEGDPARISFPEDEPVRKWFPEDDIQLDIRAVTFETNGRIQNWGIWEVKSLESASWGRAIFPVSKLYAILTIIDPKEQFNPYFEQTFVEIQKGYLNVRINTVSHFTTVPLILIVLRLGESSTPVDELVQYEPQQVHQVLFYNVHDMGNLVSDLSTALNR